MRIKNVHYYYYYYYYIPQLTIGCFALDKLFLALARFHETKIQITLYLLFEICVIVHFEG